MLHQWDMRVEVSITTFRFGRVAAYTPSPGAPSNVVEELFHQYHQGCKSKEPLREITPHLAIWAQYHFVLIHRLV